MKKINVLHLMSYCPGSGVDIQLSKIANFAQKHLPNKLSLHLLVRHSGGRFAEMKNNFTSAESGDENFVLFFFRTLKTIKRNHIDIVQAHNLKELLVSLLARRIYNVKVIYHVHHYSNFSLFRKSITSYLFNSCDRLIFVSKTLLDDYKNTFESLAKSCVIYNGVDTINNKTMSLIPSNKNTYILGTVGNFKPGIRNYKELLRLFNFAYEQGFDAELHIVGGITDKDSERHYLEVQEYSKNLSCKNKIIFWGQVNDTSQHYQNFDAFVYNSIGDTFGNAWFEAASRGIPVIINSFPLFQELGKKMNLFFYASEVEFLKQLIHVKDSHLVKELEWNQQVIASDYSFATCYEKLCDTYKKVLE